ncbi:N-alpha-acetyltransferase 50, partial [Dinochytrium kinnereticum]
FYDDECIGAICCRRELMTSLTDYGSHKVYIMTLGVLAPYRRLQIGTLLVETITSRCKSDTRLDHIALHVQTTNKEAIRFYKSRSFRIETKVDGYYLLNKGVEPPDAYLLRRDLLEVGQLSIAAEPMRSSGFVSAAPDVAGERSLDLSTDVAARMMPVFDARASMGGSGGGKASSAWAGVYGPLGRAFVRQAERGKQG